MRCWLVGSATQLLSPVLSCCYSRVPAISMDFPVADPRNLKAGLVVCPFSLLQDWLTC
jgi:hypothetical protein